MRYDVGQRAAIVTGGGSGIGASVADLLARNGASVLVVDRDREAAETVVASIEAEGGQAVAHVADVTDRDAATKMVKAALSLGSLRIAVNNAGVSGGGQSIDAVPPEEWHRVVSVNLDGVFYGLRAQLPAIAEAGGGAIVNVSSILGSVGFGGASAYVSAKHAVVGLTKSAAIEFAPQRVRVSAVAPGFIATPLLGSTRGDDEQSELALRHPLGRLGEAHEVAALIAFLVSDAATFITGSLHHVDGGYCAQ